MIDFSELQTIVESSADFVSIAEIIRGFKTFSAREINNHRQLRGVPVWQRNGEMVIIAMG
jgi:hypothetical protein